jgi:hypothetical protein
MRDLKDKKNEETSEGWTVTRIVIKTPDGVEQVVWDIDNEKKHE